MTEIKYCIGVDIASSTFTAAVGYSQITLPGSLLGFTHRPQFRTYLLRKTKEGKPARLVLNNVENKLIRIMCAVLNSKTALTEKYHSVQPLALQKALTASYYSE